LYPDTSTEDVKAYVQSKIPNALITAEKFIFSYARDISPLKLTVPPELFITICGYIFWPNVLLIKEMTPQNK